MSSSEGLTNQRTQASNRPQSILWSRHIFASALMILLTSLSAASQLRGGQGWIWQNPLPQGNPLYSIHFGPDKETGLAVGADSTILRTRDGGFTWERQAWPIENTFSSAFVIDKNSAFIVGSRGTVLSTVN